MRRAALALLAVGFATTLLPGPWGADSVSDLPIYGSYAHLFLEGQLPYRDVAFEYPPLAAPLLALPGLAGTGEHAYRLAFAALALVLAAVLVLLIEGLAERTGADRRRAMLAAAAAPLLCGALVRTRFDLAPVVLTLGALLLLCSGRPRAGLTVLGLGVLAKGFPLVVAPVALAWLVARGERREAIAAAAAFVVTLAAMGAAALVLSPPGALHAVTYHLDRPVQIESAPAVVLFALDGLGAGGATVVHSFGSEGVLHPAAGAVGALFAALLACTVGLLSLAAAREPTARGLVLASLAAVAAFAAFGKVLSPQFMIWLVPLAALGLGWRMYPLAATATAAFALTLVEFPSHYIDVVRREHAALLLVTVRDGLLVLAVVLAAAGVRVSPLEARARGSARSRRRGRARPPRPAPR